ncbi:MAG TPA: pyrroline-5-carboxylate reductase [Candidatus Sulfotelmatobacter sp.]|jgi:pyrroline-5-carboxylate reductase|nr:pyrroline-5-carboxylate reductase [Candidatus Sulfotelmatobacter sp.]
MSLSTAQTETGRTTGTQAKKKIAMLGCGKMGTILLESFLERKLITAQEAVATVQHGERSPELSRELGGVPVGTDNRAAVKGAATVLLGVKPQVLGQLLDEIAPALDPGTLVISIAASTTTSFIQQKLGKDVPVVRAMPNTPAMVGAAMTAISPGPAAKHEHVETAKHLFESVGRALVVDEKHMDAITALSASGPAFVFVILESLAEAGVKVGLPREMATMLAAQTLFGSAQLALETGHHPALLKDAVTTPAGCTIEGLMELEKGGLRVTLMNAVIKTTARARELMTG